MEQLTNSFSYALPGSTYEVSPDYGMMSQAWNIYAVATPIVTQFFGFEPKAHQKQMIIKPRMPSHWDNAAISNVSAGDNSFSLVKASKGNEVSYEISQTGDWQISIQLPDGASSIKVDGKEYQGT